MKLDQTPYRTRRAASEVTGVVKLDGVVHRYCTFLTGVNDNDCLHPRCLGFLPPKHYSVPSVEARSPSYFAAIFFAPVLISGSSRGLLRAVFGATLRYVRLYFDKRNLLTHH